MTNSILCRLGYLVTPKAELWQALGLGASAGHEIGQPWTVITPLRDYEDTFEGWKRQWRNKAKSDFLAEFVSTWSEEFPDFTARLAAPDAFELWWDIRASEVVEIDAAWTPS